MSLTIVSGGQTGADRGAFKAAIQLGLPYGGWAPRGFIAEDGTIPDIYRANMRESSSPNYGMRTRLNVQDSDATLILSFAAELSGGSDFTGRTAKQQKKPCKHLVLPQGNGCVPDDLRAILLEWIRERHIAVLNVAGPRESKEPGIEAAVCKTMTWLLEPIAVDEMKQVVAVVNTLADLSPPSRPRGDSAEADAFVDMLQSTPRPMSKDDFDSLREAFYAIPGNGAGGSLHVVLDDHNWERESVQFCRDWAIRESDEVGQAFADALLELSDGQLRDYCGQTYCGRCCQDLQPCAGEDGCRCPEGPLT